MLVKMPVASLHQCTNTSAKKILTYFPRENAFSLAGIDGPFSVFTYTQVLCSSQNLHTCNFFLNMAHQPRLSLKIPHSLTKLKDEPAYTTSFSDNACSLQTTVPLQSLRLQKTCIGHVSILGANPVPTEVTQSLDFNGNRTRPQVSCEAREFSPLKTPLSSFDGEEIITEN